jgi:hypothetical protein
MTHLVSGSRYPSRSGPPLGTHGESREQSRNGPRCRFEAGGAAPAHRSGRPQAHGRRSAARLHGAPASQWPSDSRRNLPPYAKSPAWARLFSASGEGPGDMPNPYRQRCKKSCLAFQCLPPRRHEERRVLRSVGVLTTRFSGTQQPQPALSKHESSADDALAGRSWRAKAAAPGSAVHARTLRPAASARPRFGEWPERTLTWSETRQRIAS